MQKSSSRLRQTSHSSSLLLASWLQVDAGHISSMDAKIISRDLVRLLMQDETLKGQIEAAIREAGSGDAAEQQQTEADQPQQQLAAS